MSRKRAVIAGLLSLVVPGSGHAYLRTWIRAIAWFVIALSTVALFLSESTIQSIESGGYRAAIEASRTLPTRVYLVVFLVRVMSALDAVLYALRSGTPGTRTETEGRTCPNCGGELDEDLSFCHWCTTRLEGERA